MHYTNIFKEKFSFFSVRTKYIIVTGGVLSGLGKGIAAASIGKLLNSKYKVIPIKCEGYLNVEPGTMNPIEHGEVFVLEDGEESDMDFGHYERFIGIKCKSHWNITMGKVFRDIIEKERRGDFLGKTVQYIPHVTNLIKEKIRNIAKEEKADIVIIEIGGTVGDIETALHLESMRQLKRELGNENVLFVHLTYVPKPFGVDEQKSKPTQQSVNLLNNIGITPDIIIGRCSERISESVKNKIALFCNVEKEDVISGIDVKSVYEVPLVFYNEGIVDRINKKLKIKARPKLNNWKILVNNLIKVRNKEGITIALCGKYTQLKDSYTSINEALSHCSANLGIKVNLKLIETTLIEEGKLNVEDALKNVNGIIIPGGFGSRGIEGKIRLIQYARENNVPFLGICYGMQLAVIEFARNICGLRGANTTEVDPHTKYPVITILPSQMNVKIKGGTMRKGEHVIDVKANTLAFNLYKSNKIRERFRHRYEVNPEYIEMFSNGGIVFSGKAPGEPIMQIMELKGHPYFIGTQYHGELTSKLENPGPVFLGLVKSAVGFKNKL